MQSTEPLRGGEDVVRWYAAGIATCHLHRSALGPASSREGGGVADRHSTPSPQSLGGLAVVVTYSPITLAYVHVLPQVFASRSLRRPRPNLNVCSSYVK
jgi:hypothetical protein